MTEFILMLTHQDRTLAGCLDVYDEVRDAGVRFVGFKDVGVAEETLTDLTTAIKNDGSQSVLEVVSLTEEDELRSAELAVRLEVDYLIGGTRIAAVQPVLEGTDVKYFPYVGEVIGHPAKLGGEPDDIVVQALAAQERGVDGINLLAYRYLGDGLQLAGAVNEALDVPLICAGGVDSLIRVKELADLGVWALTIGGAVVTKTIVPGAGLREQVRAVLENLDGSGEREIKGAD